MMKMGRPKKPKADRMGELIPIRVSTDERKAIDAAAGAQGVLRSKWIRDALQAALAQNRIGTEGVGLEPRGSTSTTI